jgi:hypothetical protein
VKFVFEQFISDPMSESITPRPTHRTENTERNPRKGKGSIASISAINSRELTGDGPAVRCTATTNKHSFAIKTQSSAIEPGTAAEKYSVSDLRFRCRLTDVNDASWEGTAVLKKRSRHDEADNYVGKYNCIRVVDIDCAIGHNERTEQHQQ